MIQSENARLKFAWISLTIIGIAILIFGLIVAVLPGSGDASLMQTAGVASIGMGLFGVLISLIPFKRRERWAWYTLWFYPIFWLAHFVGNLPPGKDHIHQILFILLSLASLLVSRSEFFA